MITVVIKWVTFILSFTIVASHSLGGLSGDVTADHTLFFDTNIHCEGGASCANSLTGDPRLVDPASGDYHIGPGSAAIDVAVNAGVTTDMDNDPRPLGAGYDIGADEFDECHYVPAMDFNKDGRINIIDIETVTHLWGTSNPNGDVNNDGKIDINDIRMVACRWRTEQQAIAQ